MKRLAPSFGLNADAQQVDKLGRRETYDTESAQVLWKALKCQKVVAFRAFGNSMLPFYPPGTLFLLEGFRQQTIKVGDLLLIEDEAITYLHRVIKLNKKPKLEVTTKGDSSRFPDSPVSKTEFRAIAVEFVKGNRFVSLKTSSEQRKASITAWLSKFVGIFNRCLRKLTS